MYQRRRHRHVRAPPCNRFKMILQLTRQCGPRQTTAAVNSRPCVLACMPAQASACLCATRTKSLVAAHAHCGHRGRPESNRHRPATCQSLQHLPCRDGPSPDVIWREHAPLTSHCDTRNPHSACPPCLFLAPVPACMDPGTCPNESSVSPLSVYSQAE